MVIIEYSKNGHPISDFDLDNLVEAICNLSNAKLIYSTSNIFFALKLAIVKRQIDCEKIKFEFNGQILNINKYGAIEDWPDGFADIDAKMCEKILMTAIGIRKQERSDKNGGVNKN